MSKPDKATTERFTRTLRELVKRPENKVCADCKRNDPRWASWNLGVFLCIRCSGIHRGMGTHISKVKSVDLDVWTQEQMESVQKWGNRLANLYWEAHLKPGHIPPEHKMESFIRSKYESRRWALDGLPPADPSVLDNSASSAQTNSSQPAPPQSRQASELSTSISSPSMRAPTFSHPARAPVSPVATRQPQPRQLLSSNYTNTLTDIASVPAVQRAVPTAPQPSAPPNDLFTLDFHAPATPASNSTASEPKKDVKQDILSLFSSPNFSSPVVPVGLGQFNEQPAYWGSTTPQQQLMQQQQTTTPITSMVGTSGTGMWGTSSGWTAAPVVPAQPNVWGSFASPSPQQQNLFNTSAVWGVSTSSPAAPVATDVSDDSLPPQPTPKRDDAFGDIWGGFK